QVSFLEHILPHRSRGWFGIRFYIAIERIWPCHPIDTPPLLTRHLEYDDVMIIPVEIKPPRCLRTRIGIDLDMFTECPFKTLGELCNRHANFIDGVQYQYRPLPKLHIQFRHE